MISRRKLCVAVAGFGSLVAVPAAAQTWRTYTNPRFGTTIEYPGSFRPGRPPDNGAGLGFIGADGASFSVWGSHNSLKHDLASLEAFVREGRSGERVTYNQRGSNWFAISGTANGSIFYERHFISHRGTIVNGFAIRYPSGLRDRYDAIVTRMSQSFRAGRGVDTEGNP
jgi:hypothetical protein